jgi:hypothetical protein
MDRFKLKISETGNFLRMPSLQKLVHTIQKLVIILIGWGLYTAFTPPITKRTKQPQNDLVS